MIHFIILFSRQGKIRLQKWFEARSDKDKKKITRELTSTILARKPKMCNFLEWKDLQIVYKRYASLFFLFAIDKVTNKVYLHVTSLTCVICVGRQRTVDAGIDPPIRRGVGQILWLGVRTRHHLQLRKSLFHPRRVNNGGRDSRDVQKGRVKADRIRGQLSGRGDYLAGP